MSSFKTKDFVTAVYLFLHGCRLLDTTKTGEHVWFTFADADGRCETLQNDVLSGQDFVSARLFHETSRRLKHLIYNQTY